MDRHGAEASINKDLPENWYLDENYYFHHVYLLQIDEECFVEE